VQAHKDFLAQIDPADKGKFAGPVNGQDAAKPTPGSRDLDTSSPVEKFGAPVVLLDSAAGINWATPASTVLFAGQQLHWTTQSDMHMTAAYTSSSVSAEATSLYAHEGGIQAFAGNGPVSVQAHTDQLEILADKEVTVISVNDGIEVKASKKIVLQAGQASITLEGKDITFACPGTFSVKGSQHLFHEGNALAALLPGMPTKLAKFPSSPQQKPGPHVITIIATDALGTALEGANVRFFDPVKKNMFAETRIDNAGMSSEITADSNQEYRAIVGFDGWSSLHREEIADDESDFTFDPGELDEDRDIESI
jgi:type VI secretion system secreted protein VgrG